MVARIARGEGPRRGMRVIVPLLLSLAMWAFILLGLAGLWLKIFG
jgi:predicted exporter